MVLAGHGARQGKSRKENGSPTNPFGDDRCMGTGLRRYDIIVAFVELYKGLKLLKSTTLPV
jgi:hypothetical protein